MSGELARGEYKGVLLDHGFITRERCGCEEMVLSRAGKDIKEDLLHCNRLRDD